MRTRKYSGSLEHLIRHIAKRNKISTFHFVTYDALYDSDELSPDEIAEEKRPLIEVPSSELPTQTLSELAKKHCTDKQPVLGLTSLVHVRQEGLFPHEVKRHLVQLDYDVDGADDVKLEKYIADDVKKIYPHPGYIVRSSREKMYEGSRYWSKGYHFYGLDLLTEKQLADFLNLAEATTISQKDLDENWIRIQKIRGYSVLRVNATKKKPYTPIPLLRVS